MRYHWMQDQEIKQFLRYYWANGKDNNADYFTKHHPPAMHKEQQTEHLHTCNSMAKIKNTLKDHFQSLLLTQPWQGCVTPRINPSPNFPRLTHKSEIQSSTWRKRNDNIRLLQ